MHETVSITGGASALPQPTRLRKSSPRLRHHRPHVIPLFEGELPEGRRWIEGYRGKYAISEAGTPYRYHADGRCCQLKRTVQGKTVWLLIMQDFQTVRLKVAEEVARAFLGTRWFIFRDGDSLNPGLPNLQLTDDAISLDERWIPGYEREYSLSVTGQVWSFKANIRTPMKMAARICLTGTDGKQRMLSINQTMKKIYLMN